MFQRAASFASCVLLLAACTPAKAQTFFPSDTIIDTPLNDIAVIGYANQNDLDNRTNGASPIVGLVNGGSVQDMYAFNGSTINVSGGSTEDGNFLLAQDSSLVNLSSGRIGGNLIADNSSKVHMSGGSVHFNVEALGGSKVDISGGSVEGQLFSFDAAVVDMSGGSVAFGLFAAIPGGVWALSRRKRRMYRSLYEGENGGNA